MPGPPPKKSRRRRNVPARGDWKTLPDEVYDGPKPRKPSGLHAHASAVWEAAWAHPSANMWDESERLEVVELVGLAERVDREDDLPGWVSKRMMEIRDRLGLSASGRQKLRWEMPSESEEETEMVDEPDSRWGHLKPVSEA